MITIPSNPTDRDLRWFGGLGMIFLWGTAGWLLAAHDVAGWASTLFLLGLLAGATGLMKPRALRPVYIGWMWAVFPIGWMVGHLLLGIVYFGVLTPIAWGLRLIRHDPLQRRADVNAPTFWRATRERETSDYFRQF